MHTIIIGASGTGKTTLAKHLVSNRKCLVFDPFCDDWSNSEVITNIDEFYSKARLVGNTFLVIDESIQVVTMSRRDVITTLFSQARHNNNRCIIITPGIRRLPPAIRTQCTHVYLFRVSAREGMIAADEYVDSRFIKAYTLNVGEFFVKHGLDGCKKKKFIIT